MLSFLFKLNSFELKIIADFGTFMRALFDLVTSMAFSGVASTQNQ